MITKELLENTMSLKNGDGKASERAGPIVAACSESKVWQEMMLGEASVIAMALLANRKRDVLIELGAIFNLGYELALAEIREENKCLDVEKEPASTD